MASRSWKDRVKFNTSTSGTGTVTQGSAVSGFQLLAAGDDGLEFTFFIEDGTAWEVSKGTYTHSGTTLTRTLISSSTGSLLSLSGSAVVGVDWISQDAQSFWYVERGHISGLLVTKHTGANTLDISAGTCFDPSSNKIISYAGGSGVSAGSLGASQWNQVYIYDNAGTSTIEVVNNADPPSTTYSGTARQGGTNSNRRWIGSFLTTSGSAINDSIVKESGHGQIINLWVTGSPFSAPFRALSAGTSTTYASVSLAGPIPRYVGVDFLTAISLGYGTTAGNDCIVQISVDGTNQANLVRAYVSTVADGAPSVVLWASMESGTPQVYYKLTVAGSGSGPNCYIDVAGYKAAR